MDTVMKLRLLTLITSFLLSIAVFAEEPVEVTVNFIRPFDAMTVSHNVKLKIDRKQVAKLFHNEAFSMKLSPGKHVFQTSVGVSLGVPNITGFNGARKFKKKFTFEQGDYFFKVDFKPAVMGGKHEIISVTQDEYQVLVGAEPPSEGS